MKVLMITPAFPPYEGSHTQRMLAVANSLVENGLEVAILTLEEMKGHPTYNSSSLNKVNTRIIIYRAKAGKLHKKTYENSIEKDNVIIENTHVSDYKSKIKTILNKYKRNVLIPDTMIDWYYPAVRYAIKHGVVDDWSPDYIYSCSMPNTLWRSVGLYFRI